MRLRHLDVEVVYTYGDLDEELYIYASGGECLSPASQYLWPKVKYDMQELKVPEMC